MKKIVEFIKKILGKNVKKKPEINPDMDWYNSYGTDYSPGSHHSGPQQSK